MGKNKGGNKQKKQKNSNVKESIRKLDTITPDEEETFAAIVTKTLGNRRFGVSTFDGQHSFQALLPGSSSRGRRTVVGDCVFIQVQTELSGSNCFILATYTADELKALDLKKPRTTVIGTVDEDDDDELINFDDI